MTTQNDLVNRLNQMTLHYNLTWYDIKQDADNAITHINNFMGTKYPPMSVYMTHGDATYRFRSYRSNIEIFPDRYIQTVVIPYIALQVLARDEEFTQVYTKYQQDLDEGLYQMFQNEFNNVPFAFRQNPDQGVFFSPESADEAARIKKFKHHNNQEHFPSPKFLITYHLNNDNLVVTSKFVEDTKGYEYDSPAEVKGFNKTFYSYDGVKKYTLAGWTRDRGNTVAEVPVGALIHMINDIDLYAVWNEEYTIKVTNGVVEFRNATVDNLQMIILPERVYGAIIKTIPKEFAKGLPNLRTIVLPPKLEIIKTGAFDGFNGTEIIFNENYPVDITIEKNAFSPLLNVQSIIIPSNVRTIGANAFTRTNDVDLTIYVRLFKNDIPDGWNKSWFDANSKISVVYGYNG